MVRHHAYTLRQHLRPCVLSVKRRLTLDVTARVTRIGRLLLQLSRPQRLDRGLVELVLDLGRQASRRDH
jgi:hypothetical protein